MPSPRRTSERRRVRAGTVVGGLLLLLVGLALLALPFLKAPGHAEAARADLESAKAALVGGDLDTARGHVDRARRHTDEVQDAVQGFGGDVWSAIPVVGGPVDDVRRLGSALDALTGVAEVGVATLPEISGDDATLLRNGNVDLDALARLRERVDEVGALLERAEADLDEVADERLVGGDRFGSARDAAREQVAPLGDGIDRLEPVLDALPTLLGSNEQRAYLLAVLNPSELRYSGGAALSLSVIHTDDGRITIGQAFDAAESPAFFRPRYWLKVKGNPFHRGRQSIQTANYAPSWPVSGEEMLNAFRSLRGRGGAGLVVLDAVALGRMLEFTGPLRPAGYPELTSANFVPEVIGNYDAHPDTTARRNLNKSLSVPFTERFFTADRFVAKMQLLSEMAQGRHFALYFRTPETQQAFADLGFTGDLPDTEHDYIGVFTQNTNISKSDYWQRRRVTSRVRLAADGSARVRLSVEIHNDSPPAPAGFDDPRASSYTTRWNSSSIGAFLPLGATVRTAEVDGRRVPFANNHYFGRPFVRRTLQFAPQARHTFTLEYDVPRAAAVADDGILTYRLDLTPQGMVDPEAVDVTVSLPDGFTLGELPEEWAAEGRTRASYTTADLVTSPSFTLTASP